MTDIRRTIRWVIFGFSLVMLWDQWQVYNGKQATFFPSGKPAITAKANSPAASANATAASGIATVPQSTAAATPAAVPATPGASGAAAPATPRELITVSNDVMRVTFDSEGGSVVRTELLKYQGSKTGEPFVLMNDNAERVYLAQTGLVGGDFPTHKTPMTFSGDRALKDGANDLVVKFESPVMGGVKLVKVYTLRRGA